MDKRARVGGAYTCNHDIGLGRKILEQGRVIIRAYRRRDTANRPEVRCRFFRLNKDGDVEFVQSRVAEES